GDVAEARTEGVEAGLVHAAPVLLQALAHAVAELVEGPGILRDPDDRDLELAVFDHRLEGGEDLLVGQVARGPEEDEGVRRGEAHASSLVGRGFGVNLPTDPEIARGPEGFRRAAPSTSAVGRFRRRPPGGRAGRP